MSLPVDGRSLIVDGRAVQTSEPTTVQIIDSFEDGDLSEYREHTSYFDVDTNPPFSAMDGSNILEATDNGRWIFSDSGLDNYFSQGETATVWCRGRETDDSDEPRGWTMFGVDSGTTNGYGATVEWFTDDIEMRLFDSDGFSVIESTTVGTYPRDEWYRMDIEWTNTDDINLTLFQSDDTEIGSLSTNDSTYAGNTGVGFRCQQHPPFYWDFYHK